MADDDFVSQYRWHTPLRREYEKPMMVPFHPTQALRNDPAALVQAVGVILSMARKMAR